LYGEECTSANAAQFNATKLLIPARRAVSPSRPVPPSILTASEPRDRHSAMPPTTSVYKLKASASSSVKLPNSGIGCSCMPYSLKLCPERQ